jgi:hypothetical protein
MSTAATPEPEAARPSAASGVLPARDRAIGAVCVVLLLIGMPIAYLTDDPSTGDVIGMFAMIALSLAVMAWLLLRLVPAERRADVAHAGRTALILGVVALVLSVVFWTGLSIAVGAGALALGLWLREAPGAEAARGRATAAVVLGAVAVVGSFVVLLLG